MSTADFAGSRVDFDEAEDLSAAFHAAVAQLGAEQRFIKPHCPWTNGKIERLNRTLATEWAHRQIFTSNQARTAALAPWLN